MMNRKPKKITKSPAKKTKPKKASPKDNPVSSKKTKQPQPKKVSPPKVSKKAAPEPKSKPKPKVKSPDKSKPSPTAKSSVKSRLASAGKSAIKAIAKKVKETAFGLEEFTLSILRPGKTKEKIWRTKNFQQLPAQSEIGFPDQTPELPNLYSESKLVLMPKDPDYMFSYWELTPELIAEKAKDKAQNGNYRETLKINWESKSLFEPNFTFIPVFFWARKWYFGVPQVGQRYQVELGWLSDNGHFISILPSNLSELPESWANTQKRLSEQGDVLAYSSLHTKTLGSSEHLLVEDHRAFIPEWNLSSESLSSSSWSRTEQPEKSVARPPVPTVRLEVAGKVLPGTLIRVGGKTMTLNSQGKFRIEIPYDQEILTMELTSRSGARRSLTYNLKELVLT
jgi:hypothetical protein